MLIKCCFRLLGGIFEEGNFREGESSLRGMFGGEFSLRSMFAERSSLSGKGISFPDNAKDIKVDKYIRYNPHISLSNHSKLKYLFQII